MRMFALEHHAPIPKSVAKKKYNKYQKERMNIKQNKKKRQNNKIKR
jgi:hypothetical protein